MNRIISIVLLVAGAFLLIYGINASESLGSEVSKLFTGSPTDKSMWMMIGGTVAIVIGLSGTIYTSNSGAKH